MEHKDLIEVFVTQDFGEMGFIKSLLEANQILPFCPNQNAETIGLWTSSFFRRFTIYVHPKDADRAKLLIKEHNPEGVGKSPSPRMQVFARFLLVVVAVGLLGTLVVNIIGFANR